MPVCVMCNATTDKVGYRSEDRAPVCYPCCADLDRKEMQESGRFNGYLTTNKDGQWTVSNWPGSLTFPVQSMVTGRHNWEGMKQVYVWFRGPNYSTWIGRQVTGGDTEIIRCRRLKGENR